MACPGSVTVRNLSGKFKTNKALSDDSDGLLALQGIGWLIRKMLRMMTVTVAVKQYTDERGIVHIEIENVIGGGKSITTELRVLDWGLIERQDPSLGKLHCRSRCVELTDIDDDFLRQGWRKEQNEEGLIHSRVESIDHGWVQEQTWGFAEVEGQRRHVRRVVVSKGSERRPACFVLDWIQPQ